MEIKRIETYSLFEFCQQVQEAILEGWRFDFNSNELFPTAFGSMLITGMVKAQDAFNAVNSPEKLTENNIEQTSVNNSKRGRPAKQ